MACACVNGWCVPCDQERQQEAEAQRRAVLDAMEREIAELQEEKRRAAMATKKTKVVQWRLEDEARLLQLQMDKEAQEVEAEAARQQEMALNAERVAYREAALQVRVCGPRWGTRHL
jgi:hypothetical protein